MSRPRLAVLVSGHGRNLQAILDAIAAGWLPAGAACVISNRSEAPPPARAPAARVMRDIELKIYPEALAWMARGDLHYAGGQVSFRGRPLLAPLTLDDVEPAFR